MMNMNNDKMFVCDQCIYETVRKSDLKRHKKTIHDKIKDIKCNYNECNFTCSTSSDLKKHINQVHLQIKENKCDYKLCDFKCYKKCDLKRHKKSVHERPQESKKMSLGEYKIYKILENLNIEFTRELKFQDLKSDKKSPLRYDFGIRINDDKYLLLEFDGKQHFEKVRWSNVDSEQQIIERFEYLQKCDKQKDDYAKDNNHDLLRVRYNDKDVEKRIMDYFNDHYELK